MKDWRCLKLLLLWTFLVSGKINAPNISTQDFCRSIVTNDETQYYMQSKQWFIRRKSTKTRRKLCQLIWKLLMNCFGRLFGEGYNYYRYTMQRYWNAWKPSCVKNVDDWPTSLNNSPARSLIVVAKLVKLLVLHPPNPYHWNGNN